MMEKSNNHFANLNVKLTTYGLKLSATRLNDVKLILKML